MRSAIIFVATLALTACGGAATTEEAAPADAVAAESIETLEASELSALLEDGNIRLIDVRTEDEVAEGMIPGSEHIVLDSFDPAQLDLSDGREVVLYCRSGRRSAVAAERLASHTGKTARHLDGGITAWEEAGLPLAKR